MAQLLLVFFCVGAIAISGGTIQPFQHTCVLQNNLEPDVAAFSSINNIESINLKVTNRVTHQLTTRIFAIFLKQIIRYDKNIYIQLYNEDPYKFESLPEKTLEYNSIHQLHLDEQNHTAAINLEVWRTPDHQNMFPESIFEGNSLIESDIARYGLFIPSNLVNLREHIHYNMFNSNHPAYNINVVKQFITNPDDFIFLENRERINSTEFNFTDGAFKPAQCYSDSEPCALVLTSHYVDTSFFLRHIKRFNLKMIVYFMGDLLKENIQNLSRAIEQKGLKKKFLVLHWTPSEIVDGAMNFERVEMPKCEDYKDVFSSCKFEANSVAVFFNKQVEDSELLNIVRHVKFDSLKPLIRDFYEPKFQSLKPKYQIKSYRFEDGKQHVYTPEESQMEIEEIYNDIACKWLKNNTQIYDSDNQDRWFFLDDKIVINLGALLPKTSGQEYNGIETVMRMAEDEFYTHGSQYFDKYRLEISPSYSECRSDSVLNKFIQFYATRKTLLGVLGPACSAAVEPIAAISKHYQLSVITYSAEGVILDRESYPYFYRTIGSNQQYEDVFAKLFANFSWKRIAAITEDGHSYTEYISRMGSSNNNFELINKKFPREKTEKLQTEYFVKLLKELKSSNHHIIICDVHDHVLMKSLMCSASKLKMTAQEGYVWFLPVYVTLKMNETEIMNHNNSCTANELKDVLDGHFSLSYAIFGNDRDVLPNNKTVQQWKNEYKMKRNIKTISPTDYAPYVYDAIWVYAKILERLIKEDSMNITNDARQKQGLKPKFWYMNSLDHQDTLTKMTQIFESMDFLGVSGRIFFNDLGSRFTNVTILKWINGDFKEMCTYMPVVFNKTIIDGKLDFIESPEKWFSTKIDDGSERCTFQSLASAFKMHCNTINSLMIVVCCIFIIFACSGFSFLFWKRKYAKKLEESAQIMRNYGRVVNGIELSKWEISRENVIINRRIGEGAFGTVYGGEALIKDEDGWRPVAIKTLKSGSTPEQRLDFLAESEIMKRFDHKNIVKLLAVCLQKDPLYSIMEFMLFGDLKTYLLSRRHLVDDKVNEDTNDISPKRLTLMALDVARGLSYLASNNFVHRDIACRNCLINAQRIVKIGDFGMARSTCENDYYRFTRKAMLPIRWMSPESIHGGVFSHASDVWSFGVFLYEVVTLGAFPFQGLSNNQVFELVKSGESVKIPQQAKPTAKALMSSCFNIDPKKRPGASTIVEFISNYPRMLSPCMNDIPKPNLDEQVNLIDTSINDEFEFEQLIENRERSHTPAITVDFLRPSASSSALQNNIRSQEFDYLDMKLPRKVNGGIYNYSPDLTATLPNPIYNPVEPLLTINNPRSTEISKSTLSLMKYVPMCGLTKNRNRSSPEECTSAL